MEAATLTKTKTLLHLIEGSRCTYRSKEDGREHAIFMDPEVQIELGMPKVITLTIEPGDTLNERD
jgi:hypothetical protein